MINVTKTYLPEKEEYMRILGRAWDKGWITNNGELVQELEEKLKTKLGVKHLLFCTNGTIVLQMALKAMQITGEVITTPFSYVATTTAILWENCTPVFVDVNSSDYNIDVTKIEKSITNKTQAILATHVYGNPCDVEAIEKIAAKYKLKVIYDGAHAFGTMYKGRSLLSYGDVSTCSFHATKLFHTVEGGAIITNNDELARQLMLFRQFGHEYDNYYTFGTNAKNSEFHAAMGLAIFPDIDKIISKRKEISKCYANELAGLNLITPVAIEGTSYNYGYFPVIFRAEEQLLKVKNHLEEKKIFSRRYFFPSLNELPYLDTVQSCPTSESVARRVLCLPLFTDLKPEEIIMISTIIKKTMQC